MTSRGRILLADDEPTFLNATADLQMPGNADLGLVRQIAATRGGLPVLVITGVPSVRSAIACVELPVAAYLVKPVTFEDLLPRVQAAVTRFRSWQAMQNAEQRLVTWRKELDSKVALPASSATGAIDVFLSLTLRNVMGSLTDLEQLGRALAGQPVGQHACQLLNCPRGAQLQEAVRETIRVLEQTKGSFKSKTLGELRQRLELLLEHN